MAKVIFAETCPTCCRRADAPFRVFDARGKVDMGCVDHFHTGHLIPTSESARWHNSAQAKAIRAANRKARMGYVTERAA